MSNEVKNLPASELRRLLIEEIQKFIIALDGTSVEMLEEGKVRMKEILFSLSEKERREMLQIFWGKSSSSSDTAFIVPATQIVNDFDEGTSTASISPAS